jgi:CBS domain containing-hemolysin-like protein
MYHPCDLVASQVPVQTFAQLFARPVETVSVKEELAEVLHHFRCKGGHMAIVRSPRDDDGEVDETCKVEGIITLEDIFGKIMGADITKMNDTVDDDEHHHHHKKKNRDVEMSRMMMLNHAMHGSDDKLGTEEINAITAYLMKNVPHITHVVGDDEAQVRDIVTKSVVIDVFRKTAIGDTTDKNKWASEDVIYKRGKISDNCMIILSGKVQLLAGKDEFPGQTDYMSLPHST